MSEVIEAEFVAGFAVRHAVAASILDRAFAPPSGFAAVDPAMPYAADMVQPRHFSPAEPGHNPTAGWDPLDPEPEIPVDAIDPVVAAREAGYAEGYAAALAEAAAAAVAAEAARGRDEALVGGLAEALAGRFDRDALAERLRRTVLMLVEKVVGEAGVSAALLNDRVAAAGELLASPIESALLRLHPDDVALVEGKLPATVFAAGDPHVARGSFVLESASTVVEDGPALWLEQLTHAIDRVPLPSC